MRRICLALMAGLAVAASSGCDIIKETVEQAITEQSIRIGDDLENFTRDGIESAKAEAANRVMGGDAADQPEQATAPKSVGGSSSRLTGDVCPCCGQPLPKTATAKKADAVYDPAEDFN